MRKQEDIFLYLSGGFQSCQHSRKNLPSLKLSKKSELSSCLLLWCNFRRVGQSLLVSELLFSKYRTKWQRSVFGKMCQYPQIKRHSIIVSHQYLELKLLVYDKKQIGGCLLKEGRHEKLRRKLAFIFLFQEINKLNTTINAFTPASIRGPQTLPLKWASSREEPHCQATLQW